MVPSQKQQLKKGPAPPQPCWGAGNTDTSHKTPIDTGEGYKERVSTVGFEDHILGTGNV